MFGPVSNVKGVAMDTSLSMMPQCVRHSFVVVHDARFEQRMPALTYFEIFRFLR